MLNTSSSWKSTLCIPCIGLFHAMYWWPSVPKFTSFMPFGPATTKSGSAHCFNIIRRNLWCGVSTTSLTYHHKHKVGGQFRHEIGQYGLVWGAPEGYLRGMLWKGQSESHLVVPSLILSLLLEYHYRKFLEIVKCKQHISCRMFRGKCSFLNLVVTFYGSKEDIFDPFVSNVGVINHSWPLKNILTIYGRKRDPQYHSWTP